MRIAEIFHSIQGEGGLTGVPSVFVRTSGCNLRCRWCDTPYASWHPEGGEMSVDEILAEVRRHPAAHVVLTGGEPMIAKGIHELAAALHAAGKHVTIETAGTVPPDGIACDLASLSPKLRNSTPAGDQFGPAWTARHEQTRHQPQVLAAWLRDYDYQLKFVVADPADLTEIDALVARATDLPVPPWKIQLMPEGTDPATLRARRDWIVGICRERGFRFCQRLQIELFGHTRGT
jgi:7-carboxy-7-deazaguanine synthase